ncbi:MAG: DinB family protein [Acidimicrobiales bacterium]
MSDTTGDVQTCAHCGFSWTPLTRAVLATRMSRAVESFVDVMNAAGADVAARPSERRWSILEYGGHLRDVILSIRERVVLASVLDVPVGTPIFRDERVDIGFYSQDSAADVALELQVVTYLLLKTVATLPEHFDDRKLIYSDRTPLEVTISGALLNALHECEHHLGDAAEDLTLLESSGT